MKTSKDQTCHPGMIQLEQRTWGNKSTEIIAANILNARAQGAYWAYRTTLIAQEEHSTWGEKLEKLAKEVCDMVYMDSFDNIRFMQEILHLNILKVDFEEIALALFAEHEESPNEVRWDA